MNFNDPWLADWLGFDALGYAVLDCGGMFRPEYTEDLHKLLSTIEVPEHLGGRRIPLPGPAIDTIVAFLDKGSITEYLSNIPEFLDEAQLPHSMMTEVIERRRVPGFGGCMEFLASSAHNPVVRNIRAMVLNSVRDLLEKERVIKPGQFLRQNVEPLIFQPAYDTIRASKIARGGLGGPAVASTKTRRVIGIVNLSEDQNITVQVAPRSHKGGNSPGLVWRDDDYVNKLEEAAFVSGREVVVVRPGDVFLGDSRLVFRRPFVGKNRADDRVALNLSFDILSRRPVGGEYRKYACDKQLLLHEQGVPKPFENTFFMTDRNRWMLQDYALKLQPGLRRVKAVLSGDHEGDEFSVPYVDSEVCEKHRVVPMPYKPYSAADHSAIGVWQLR